MSDRSVGKRAYKFISFVHYIWDILPNCPWIVNLFKSRRQRDVVAIPGVGPAQSSPHAAGGCFRASARRGLV